MNLSDKQIIEFQKLYKKRYRKEISREDAYEMGIKFVRLIKVIYQPITDDNVTKAITINH